MAFLNGSLIFTNVPSKVAFHKVHNHHYVLQIHFAYPSKIRIIVLFPNTFLDFQSQSCTSIVHTVFAPITFRTHYFRTHWHLPDPFRQMSFDGIVAEFPFIGVDRFNTAARTFLLTHCHQDHLVGLLNCSFSGTVYCSPETRLLLEDLQGYASVLPRIKTVAYNTPIEVDLPPEIQRVYGKIVITLIHAYHCLGSCMFLIEGEYGGSVLCTGDLRAEKWWVDSLGQLPCLGPYLAGLKTLDNIYLDTTFGYRGEPYIEMPPNNLGVHVAIRWLENYPLDDPDLVFQFRDTVLGFDQAWAFILSYFRASLDVTEDKLKKIMAVAARHDELNGPMLSQAMEYCNQPLGCKTRNRPCFVAGKPLLSKQIAVRIVQCIDFNIVDLAGLFCPLPLSALSAAEKKAILNPIKSTSAGNSVVELRGRQWLLPKEHLSLLPMDVKLVFSRHSSYSECADFVSRFKPKQVYPCWSTQTAWHNGFVMARLFGKYCSASVFDFDIKMTRQLGPSKRAMLGLPVATIDRWDAGECEEEKKFVEDVLDKRKKEGQAIINVRQVAHFPVFFKERGQKSQDSHNKARKLRLNLESLASGKTTSARRFIEEQQQLYYKRHCLPQYERDFEDPRYHNMFGSGLRGTSEADSRSSDSSLDLVMMGTRSSSHVAVSVDSYLPQSKASRELNSGQSIVLNSEELEKPTCSSNKLDIMRQSRANSFVDDMDEEIIPNLFPSLESRLNLLIPSPIVALTDITRCCANDYYQRFSSMHYRHSFEALDGDSCKTLEQTSFFSSFKYVEDSIYLSKRRF